MIVPLAPGGGSDIVGRMVAQALAEEWGHVVVVDNRPGAGSTLGTAIAAQAPADGCTTLVSSSSMAISPNLYRKLSFDVVKDFSAISLLASQPSVLAVHPRVDARSVMDLVALMKAQAGKLTFGSAGHGTASHLANELFRLTGRAAAGVDLDPEVPVVVRGAPAYNRALLRTWGGDRHDRSLRPATMMLKPLEVLRLYPEHDHTLHGALASRLRREPQRPFMLFGGRTWSWGEFADAAERAAGLLAARGVRNGDRVAVMGRNSDGHVLLLFALARIGAIMVPVNPEFGVEEARYVLSDAEPVGVVAGSEALDVARKASGGLASTPWFWLLDSGRHDAPLLHDLVRRAPDAPLPAGPRADDTCVIVYTSGTTGFPKGAMHSQASFVACGEAFVQRMYLQPEERVMIVLPLFHVNALFYSVAGTLAAGCSMVVVPRFSASTFWQTAVDTGATEVNIIEAIGTILKNRPRSEFRPGHRVRKLYGAREAVAATFRDEFGIPHLVGGFGMTEIPGVTCNPFEGPHKPGSMGPVGRHPDPARPWAQCRVVDDEGRDVATGEAGELIVKTPIVTQGYFRNPEQTRAAFRDGWFMTGDLVRRDAEGYYWFIGRKKDIIRRRGENISGAELDRVIGEHPAVHEAAAIAVPSELGEDEILVAIVPKPGRRLTADEVAQWCRERLAPMKVPRYVLLADELPHTPTHKVAKAVLRSDRTLVARATDLAAPAARRAGRGS